MRPLEIVGVVLTTLLFVAVQYIYGWIVRGLWKQRTKDNSNLGTISIVTLAYLAIGAVYGYFLYYLIQM